MSTTSPRTRLVWKTREIRRTAAALAAYAIIGVLGAGFMYGVCLALYIAGTALGAH